MTGPLIGEVLHGLKAADWECVRVEAVGADWVVARTRDGWPVFTRRDDLGIEDWHRHGVRCPYGEGGDDGE